MNQLTLPINEIQVLDRQRQDYGDIESLAKSLSQYGLIQPIVVTSAKPHRLVAGGRRLEAAKSLRWNDIPVVFKETLSADQLHEMELEENVRRKEMHWGERVLCIEQIHRLKKARRSTDNVSWGQRETGELLGVSAALVNYSLRLASELRADTERKGPYWACDNASAAWNLLMRKEQESVEAELARRTVEQANKGVELEYDSLLTEPTEEQKTLDQVEYEQAKAQYLSNPHNDPALFDEYFKARQQKRREAPVADNTIFLTKKLHMGDCIEYMMLRPASFDHIITDIPYGINMETLDQDNPHGGMVDIDTVEEEHDVEENKDLMAKFFPAAYGAVREGGFVATWCDIMLWQYMYDLAVKAGFKVQRWPVTWVKTHQCMNQCASFNFTKNTEIAIICRKQGATLNEKASTCVVSASNQVMRLMTGHPFAKPFEAWEFLAKHIAYPGQTILDPFCGRGSSIISFLRMGYNAFGCEINVAHYNALLENIKRHYLSINPNFKFA